MEVLRNQAMKKQQKKNQQKNSFWLYFIATPLIGIVLLFAWSVRLSVLATGEDAFWFTVMLMPVTVLVLFALGLLMSRHATKIFKKKRSAVTMVLLSAGITVAVSVLLSGVFASMMCDACFGARWEDTPMIILLFFLPILAATMYVPLAHAKRTPYK